jgi:uncharacterized membrane-anchored protein
MTSQHALRGRTLLTKVPEVTIWFWIIKILCTTVGETAADFLNVSLNLGLTGTSVVTGVLLAGSLTWQFAAPRYVAARYWTTVTLVSVFGTLVTDNLSTAGLPLETSTLVFGALLVATFLLWYRSEGTLSIHSIHTRRRETFYWVTILVTFALGTATGDLMSETLGLGYATTGLIVAALIAVIAVGWRLGLHSVLSFWVVYVLTRPLGASIGDYLSQTRTEGGLGLGPTVTSAIFLVAILGIVVFLAVTRADVIDESSVATERTVPERHGMLQTIIVVGVLAVASVTGYSLREIALRTDDTAAVAAPVATPADAGPVAAVSPLGDLSTFRTISQDTLDLLDNGDQAGATTRVGDLETEWDKAQARLKPKDDAAWTTIDGKIDTVLRELRAAAPNPGTEKAALTDLLAAL